MVKFFTQACPMSPVVSQSGSIVKINRGCMTIIKGHLVPIGQARSFADEGVKKPSNKKDQPMDTEPLKMPGFVHPEVAKEEEHFSKLTKEQIGIMKKKQSPGQPVIKKEE